MLGRWKEKGLVKDKLALTKSFCVPGTVVISLIGILSCNPSIEREEDLLVLHRKGREGSEGLYHFP